MQYFIDKWFISLFAINLLRWWISNIVGIHKYLLKQCKRKQYQKSHKQLLEWFN